MSGAVAAHAAYNGSGTQGLAVTNKIHDDDGDVMSVFWNKNDTTRQLLYGSSIIEIPSSGASTLSFGSSRLFSVNNDIDCLGDMYLQLTAQLPTYKPLSDTTTFGGVSLDPAAVEILTTGVTVHATATPNGFITSTDHRFTSGTLVTYAKGTGSDLDGLTDGDNYSVIRLDANKFTLAETTTPGTAIKLTGTGNDAQTLTPVGSVSLEINVKPFALQSLVDRVEIQVGTQIWQTIENSDLRVVNSTELPADAYSQISSLSTPSAYNAATTAWLVIPSLTKTTGPRLGKFTNQTEDGYPMAAAPHQGFKIKVYFAELPDTLSYAATAVSEVNPTVVQFAEKVPLEGTITPAFTPAQRALNDFANNTKGGLVFTGQKAGGSITSCNLYAKQQIMCNEEREQMKAMPAGLPKRLKMTQNSYTSDLGSSTIKTIELDHFSLYASHLIISGNAGGGTKLSSAELKLNSSSFSGQLPGVLLDSCTSDSLGLYSNKHIYGSGTTGAAIKVEEFGIGTYVFPLAATAFGGSCVPLNRFDSVRLTLTFTDAPKSGSSTFLNVTCVGETTALFKGGAASLAMY